ncbi:MAG: hypothetical protein AAF696_02540 [Bacteroidota bacterium]
MKKITSFMILFVVLFHFSSKAQRVRNIHEASTNNKAIQVGKEQLERDITELAAFKTKVQGLETALTNRTLPKVKAFKKDIVSDMYREINQSEQKLAQAKREVAQSRSESRASSRELGRSRRDRASRDGDLGDRRDVRDDRRDKRDDQRDLADDRMDVEKRVALTARQKQILNALEAFSFSVEPSAREKAIANIRLMNEFVELMERDIAATRMELTEDQAEKREDRRERLEDRRGRRRNN